MGRTEVSHPALSVHNSGSCKGYYSKLGVSAHGHTQSFNKHPQASVPWTLKSQSLPYRTTRWGQCGDTGEQCGSPEQGMGALLGEGLVKKVSKKTLKGQVRTDQQGRGEGSGKDFPG